MAPPACPAVQRTKRQLTMDDQNPGPICTPPPVRVEWQSMKEALTSAQWPAVVRGMLLRLLEQQPFGSQGRKQVGDEVEVVRMEAREEEHREHVRVEDEWRSV